MQGSNKQGKQLTARQIADKREREKRVVSEMIAIYCHGQKHERAGAKLCADCAVLDQYAQMRSDKCPFMATKTFCANCRVHCYRPEMREKIRQVMRYAGPRMMLHHPVMALRHLIESKKEKKRLVQEGK